MGGGCGGRGEGDNLTIHNPGTEGESSRPKIDPRGPNGTSAGSPHVPLDEGDARRLLVFAPLVSASLPSLFPFGFLCFAPEFLRLQQAGLCGLLVTRLLLQVGEDIAAERICPRV